MGQDIQFLGFHMMRRALLVGIDHYDNFAELRCAVNDAKRLEQLLARHDDGSLNYTVRLEVSSHGKSHITRAYIRKLWLDLFGDFDGDVLFYFAGHGVQTPWGGCLVTQDGSRDE